MARTRPQVNALLPRFRFTFHFLLYREQRTLWKSSNMKYCCQAMAGGDFLCNTKTQIITDGLEPTHVENQGVGVPFLSVCCGNFICEFYVAVESQPLAWLSYHPPVVNIRNLGLLSHLSIACLNRCKNNKPWECHIITHVKELKPKLNLWFV